MGAERDAKGGREGSGTEAPALGRAAEVERLEGAGFHLVPERVRARPTPAGYPPEWPAVSWLVRVQAGFRCEHCGRRFPPGGVGEEALGVHHLDGDRYNLWDWNLVPLCLVDHGLVEREVHVDREQLAMFGSSFRWLGPRLAARARTIESGLWAPGDRRRRLAVLGGDEPGTLEDVQRRGSSGVRYCACGCGRSVAADPRARYATDACRVRAFRARRGQQRDLMELLAAGTGAGRGPVG